MSINWKEKMQYGRDYHSRNLANAYRIEDVIDKLGLDDYAGLGNTHNPSITIYSLPSPGEIKRLLPLVGKFEKGYDSDHNELTLSATFEGVSLTFKAEPPDTCTVEVDEEEVEVEEEITPAHTETRRTYRLVGDCDPIMQPEPTDSIGE